MNSKSRNIKDLEESPEADAEPVKKMALPAYEINKKARDEELVTMHYPKVTPLAQILAEMAEWSGLNFVVDPSLLREMQIFAPRKMKKDEAFSLFTASLEIAGLRAVKNPEHNVVKIVSKAPQKLVV